jgi:hypothetical protein
MLPLLCLRQVVALVARLRLLRRHKRLRLSTWLHRHQSELVIPPRMLLRPLVCHRIPGSSRLKSVVFPTRHNHTANKCSCSTTARSHQHLARTTARSEYGCKNPIPAMKSTLPLNPHKLSRLTGRASVKVPLISSVGWTLRMLVTVSGCSNKRRTCSRVLLFFYCNDIKARLSKPLLFSHGHWLHFPCLVFTAFC